MRRVQPVAFAMIATSVLALPALAAPIAVSSPAEPSVGDGAITPPGASDDLAGLLGPDRLRSPVVLPPAPEAPTARIVNGVEAAPGQYPEVVFLEIEGLSGSESSCTGSLISPEWVLTAAHCLDAIAVDSSGQPDFGRIVPTPRIRVHFTHVVGSGNYPIVTSDAIVLHPDWGGQGTVIYTGDIALVRLAEPQPDAPVMALNERVLGQENIGDEISFIGYGRTEWQGGGTGIQRYNLEKVVALPESQPYLLNSFDLQNRQPSEGGQSTCQGDSGGPGVFLQGSAILQASITSHGPECGRGPSGHMRVDHYIDWIRDFEPEILTKAASTPSFECSNQLNPGAANTTTIGVVPFDLKCAVDYQAPPGERLERVTWNWGDGSDSVVVESGDLFRASHAYERDGRFTVTMEAEYTQGGTTKTKRLSRFGYVRACGVPQVAFSVEKDEGLAYRFINETNLTQSYGCVTGTQWDLFAGDSVSGEPLAQLKTWEPTFSFPETGTYTAVLNVGSYSGTVAAQSTFKVTAARGGDSGCNQSGGLAGFGAVALAGLALVRRRR